MTQGEIIDEVYKYGQETYGENAVTKEEIQRILPNSSYYKCIGSSNSKNTQLACIYDYIKNQPRVGGKSRSRRRSSRRRRRKSTRRTR